MTNRHSASFFACFSLMLAHVSGTSAEQPVSIDLRDLPQPPESIEKLIEVGHVSFTHGPRERETSLEGRRRLAAETTYRMTYDYRSRSRWTVKRVGRQRQLVITVRFNNISLKPNHVVWFRKPPRTSGFWQQKLVLHEIDHVIISSDVRHTRRFEELLQDNTVIKSNISDQTAVDSRMVNRLIEQHVKQVFDEVLELVSIRYRELDRVTDHGLRALPEGSSLHEFLRNSSSGK